MGLTQAGGGILQHLHLPDGRLQAQGLVQLVQLRAQIVELYLVFIKLKHVKPHSFP